MIHCFRTIDYCIWLSFSLLTYVNFLHFLDNDDRMSSKRRDLSALVFLINLITKVNLIRILKITRRWKCTTFKYGAVLVFYEVLKTSDY